jgi:hypothetical protein
MLRRRSTDVLIEDISTGRAEPHQGAGLSCLPLCDESHSDCGDTTDLMMFEDLDELEESARELLPGMWLSNTSDDDVDDRDCHDTRLRHELEYFMNQSIDMVSPPTVRPSEPTSPKIPLRLPPTLPGMEVPNQTDVPQPNLLQQLLSAPRTTIETKSKQKSNRGRKRGGKRTGSGLFFQPNLYVVQRSLPVAAALSELVIHDGIPHLRRKRRLARKFQ